MLRVQLICVGKLKEAFYLQACGEYCKRLAPLCKLTVVELPEIKLPDSPAPAQIQAALAREGEAILEKVPKGSMLIPLCIEGQLLSSPDLAGTLERWSVEGISSVSFVIGGSFGLSPTVKAGAALKLSMSPMTFPHHLARVMLLEQLYRALQINVGSKYHK